MVGSVAQGVASIAGGRSQSKAAKRAASDQMAMFNQIREDLEPWRKTGTAALGVLNRMFIPGGGEVNPEYQAIQDRIDKLRAQLDQAPTLDFTKGDDDRWHLGRLFRRRSAGAPGSQDEISRLEEQLAETPQFLEGGDAPDYSAFYKSPGYEFRLGEGTRTRDRSASARGMLRSGAHERELIRYGQGFASNEFNNYANRLSSLAGVGQTATTQTGQFGMASQQIAGNLRTDAATARASGYIGAANALTNAQARHEQNAMALIGMGGGGGGFSWL